MNTIHINNTNDTNDFDYFTFSSNDDIITLKHNKELENEQYLKKLYNLLFTELKSKDLLYIQFLITREKHATKFQRQIIVRICKLYFIMNAFHKSVSPIITLIKQSIQQNMQIIQNAIRYHFSTKGHQIAEQDPTTLQIIMRSIYLQYSKNWSCKIKEQIKTLNEYVIAECIQSISTKNEGYFKIYSI